MLEFKSDPGPGPGPDPDPGPGPGHEISALCVLKRFIFVKRVIRKTSQNHIW